MIDPRIPVYEVKARSRWELDCFTINLIKDQLWFSLTPVIAPDHWIVTVKMENRDMVESYIRNYIAPWKGDR